MTRAGAGAGLSCFKFYMPGPKIFLLDLRASIENLSITGRRTSYPNPLLGDKEHNFDSNIICYLCGYGNFICCRVKKL